MQVACLVQHLSGGFCQFDFGRGTIPQVEYEIALTVFPVANKCGASYLTISNGDGAGVHAVNAEPLDVQPTKIVVTEGRDNATGGAEAGHLVDKDSGRSTRERAYQFEGLTKTGPRDDGYYLDQHFTQSCDFAQFGSSFGASAAGTYRSEPRMTENAR